QASMRNRSLGLFGVFSLTTLSMAMSVGCGDFGDGSDDATGGQGTGGGNASTGGAGNGTGGAPPIQVECTTTYVTPCGGDLTGTWHVGASCMELSGDMDVSLTSLGCPTVPVIGTLSTTGSITLNADGTYTDNTHTTGAASFPLDPSCLSVSSVDVTCEEIGSIFTAVGWTTSVCAYTGDQCNCELTVDAAGALGAVVPYSQMTGHYSIEGNS